VKALDVYLENVKEITKFFLLLIVVVFLRVLQFIIFILELILQLTITGL